MKTTKIIFFFLLVIRITVNGQHLPDIPISSPVLIEHALGTGTGFFICDSTTLYFVTAKHNFIDLNSGKLLVNETILTTYKEDPITGDKIIFKIDLNLANSSGLIFTKPLEDALIIKIADLQHAGNNTASIRYDKSVQKLSKSTFLDPLPIEMIENYENVHVGDDIFIFGYPTSIGLKQVQQFDYTRPLLRKGIIAGKYDLNKTLILDCTSYPGNSGGPVIVKIDSSISIDYKLVGLIVQFIPYEEQWINIKSGSINTDRYNSGYSVAVSASKILELLNKK